MPSLLRNMYEVVDMGPTARQIESIIDEFIKAWKTVELTVDGIKRLAIKRFQLSFPIVKSTVQNGY
jgi:hypothetical protein